MLPRVQQRGGHYRDKRQRIDLPLIQEHLTPHQSS
jgi:hypothetical protein